MALGMREERQSAQDETGISDNNEKKETKVETFSENKPRIKVEMKPNKTRSLIVKVCSRWR